MLHMIESLNNSKNKVVIIILIFVSAIITFHLVVCISDLIMLNDDEVMYKNIYRINFENSIWFLRSIKNYRILTILYIFLDFVLILLLIYMIYFLNNSYWALRILLVVDILMIFTYFLYIRTIKIYLG